MFLRTVPVNWAPIALLALIFALSASPAYAIRADEMASKCRSVSNATIRDDLVDFPEDFDSGECWGYFRAIQRISVYAVEGRRLLGICAPKDSRLSQFVRIFVVYVDQHPEKGHLESTKIAIEALARVFPC